MGFGSRSWVWATGPQPGHRRGSASPLSWRSSGFNWPASGLDATTLGLGNHSFCATRPSVRPGPGPALGVCRGSVESAHLPVLLELLGAP